MTPTPPIDPPPRVFTDRTSPTDLTVWIELHNVFDSGGQVHSCACGLGVANPLPPAMVLGSGVEIGYFDTVLMEITETIPQFAALMPNAATSAGWAAGPSTPDPLTGSPLVSNWSGFGGNVQPVTPRALGPNEIFVMCYSFDVPASFAITGSIDAQIGGGLANEDFTPMFGERPDADSHFAAYSAVFQFPVPTPAASAVLVAAGLICATCRRR